MTQHRAMQNPNGEGLILQRRDWWAPWWRTLGHKERFCGCSTFVPAIFDDREAAVKEVERLRAGPVFVVGSLF